MEQDQDLAQALIAVVVRNQSGAVLRLRRREKMGAKDTSRENVIWEGRLGDSCLSGCYSKPLGAVVWKRLEPQHLVGC